MVVYLLYYVDENSRRLDWLWLAKAYCQSCGQYKGSLQVQSNEFFSFWIRRSKHYCNAWELIPPTIPMQHQVIYSMLLQPMLI